MLNVHLTLARTRGGPPVPDVFNSCSFIPRAHFETSLVMVSCYGYEIRRQSSRWSSQFWVKVHVFSTSFKNKKNLVACKTSRQQVDNITTITVQLYN